MIIPNIRFNTSIDLIEQIERWSLFGQLAISDLPTSELEPVVNALKLTGGLADIDVHFDSFDESAAVMLLNAGARNVLVEGDSIGLETIPDDRIQWIKNDDSPDEAIPAGRMIVANPELPLGPRLSELEMARFDCLVDTKLLTTDLLVEFFKSILVTDREDGLWSTVIVDPLGIALGLAYSNEESLRHALEHRVGTYWSRSRDELWIKGETSGATQRLLNVRFDCDRDCLRFMVTQDAPGFCHRKYHSCFGPERTIHSVAQRLADRIKESDEQSFTFKLTNDPEMLKKKLLEEAGELAAANAQSDPAETTWEAADVLYFAMVALAKQGIGLESVHQELARRMHRVVRRPPGVKDAAGELS